jgi:cytochrome c551/c552
MAARRSKLKEPTMMKRLALAALAASAVVFAGEGDAFAQQKGGVITINEVTIVGRVQKPVASVDVSKIQPKLTLAELRQPFLDRIEEAARKDPF